MISLVSLSKINRDILFKKLWIYHFNQPLIKSFRIALEDVHKCRFWIRTLQQYGNESGLRRFSVPNGYITKANNWSDRNHNQFSHPVKWFGNSVLKILLNLQILGGSDSIVRAVASQDTIKQEQ